jgi:hypothetical protein
MSARSTRSSSGWSGRGGQCRNAYALDPMLDTAQHLPVKAETILKWTNELDTPETRAALQQMYKVGETVPNAQNWYMMGQLEREYIKEYGPTVGREQFRNRFGGAMAATTGGAA